MSSTLISLPIATVPPCPIDCFLSGLPCWDRLLRPEDGRLIVVVFKGESNGDLRSIEPFEEIELSLLWWLLSADIIGTGALGPKVTLSGY